MTDVVERKAYVIYCRTGCSCCSDDNHYRGPFSTEEIAKAKCNEYSNDRVLASQYSHHGWYDIEKYDVEILPDGRIIVDNTVFEDWAEKTGRDKIEMRWY